jgi:hypothetical protein
VWPPALQSAGGILLRILATFDTHDSRLPAIREASLFWGKKKGRYLSAPSTSEKRKLPSWIVLLMAPKFQGSNHLLGNPRTIPFLFACMDHCLGAKYKAHVYKLRSQETGMRDYKYMPRRIFFQYQILLVCILPFCRAFDQ